ncbi:MAG TPA: hypothetical protein VFV31_11795 [Chitinophagaceae bacterium]|nr:hypothetical protein [Chitinophagaceae bacterium]
MLGAILLGFTIHFIISSNRSFRESVEEAPGGKIRRELDEWRSRFLNENELRLEQVEKLQQQLREAQEDRSIYEIEADEIRKQNKQLLKDLEELNARQPKPAASRSGYLEQLEFAQNTLLQQNEKIAQLLSQIDIVKETEERQQELLRENEELKIETEALQLKLMKKEKEMATTLKKEHLTTEMNSMLDSAYNEFGVLQDKIQKLESQVIFTKKINMEYEDLKEGYYKLSKDFEELKLKYNHQLSESRQLQEELAETEDKLKEANFQRQQLQKRVSYLEEINNDMQAVADANKKLESQIKRIGELESMLNVLTEERDILAKKQ